MEKESKKFYEDVLRSEECQCGKVKRKNLAVCYRCYIELPQEIKRQLWLKIEQGFEEGYEQAVKYLQDL